MASLSSTAVFLVFLLSAALVLPSLAQPIISLAAGVQLTSNLTCSVTANLPGPPLVGANVTLACLGIKATVSALTNTNGLVNLTLNIPGGISGTSPILPCTAELKLPVVNCTLLPSTGTLVSLVNSLGTVVTTPIGILIQATISAFI